MPRLNLNEAGFTVQLNGADECIDKFKQLNKLLAEAKKLVLDLERDINQLSIDMTGEGDAEESIPQFNYET